MKKEKTYLRLTIILSILFGILLPLALGLRDPTLIAITFSFIWVLYPVLLLISTFLIKPTLRIKVSRQKGVAVVRYELLDSKRN